MAEVTSVRCLGGFVVELGFADGATKVRDLGPLLRGPVFFPHRVSPDFFRSVMVDPRVGTIVWPNQTDLDPEVLRWDLEPEACDGPPDDDSQGGDLSILGIAAPVALPRERSGPGRLSRFFGIDVSVDGAGQAPPHLRASSGDDEALVRLDTLEVLAGSLPRRALGFVAEWAVLHRAELEEAWARAHAGQPLAPIAPLE